MTATVTAEETRDKYHLIIAALVGLNGWTKANPLKVPLDRLYDAERLLIVITPDPDPNSEGILIYGERVSMPAATGSKH